MGCNAQIDVGGVTVTCVRKADVPHGTFFDVPHFDSWSEVVRAVCWTDGAPGATPHRESKWVAACGEFGEWGLAREGEAAWVATFHVEHPDPEGAARTEAARLNGEATDVVEPTWWTDDEYHEVMQERDAARAEADRYRDALAGIAGIPWSDAAAVRSMKRWAREALYGKDDR